MAEKHTPEMRKNHRMRVRKRIAEQGADSLEVYKLLEAFLFYSLPRVDTYPVAHQLLDRFKTIEGVFSASREELTELDGVGPVTAEHIIVTGELIRRAVIDELTSFPLDNEARTISLLTWMMKDMQTDAVTVIGLDSGMRYVDSRAFPAGETECAVCECVERFSKNGAEKFVFAHRHPERYGSPTAEDIESTTYLKKVCEESKVSAVEHYIVTKSGAFGILGGMRRVSEERDG